MITKAYQVVNIQPDITDSKFTQVLKDAGSPAAANGPGMYQAIIKRNISPAFALALFQHESNFGKLGVCHDYDTKNMGNTRSSRIGVDTFVTVPGKGQYIKYDDWETGARDLAVRLMDPDFIYARTGLKTIAQILPVFAPVADSNRPDKYIEAVVLAINSWTGNSEVTPMAIQIDDRSGQLASGKSANRGNYKIDELILHETSGPHDVRNASPDLARTLDDATISWFLTLRSDVSIHYLIGGENLGAPIYRLCPESQAAYHIIGEKGSVDGFSIDNHESIGIERMGQPNDNPGPNQTRALCELALDICKRNPHITPDRIFSHASLQPDRRDGNTLLAVVKKFVSDNLGVNHVTSNNQGPLPGQPTQINGKTLGGGFKAFYDRLAAAGPNLELLTLGFPVTNEFDCPLNGVTSTVQLFERAGLVYQSANAAPWDVHGMTLSELAQALEVAKSKSLLN